MNVFDYLDWRGDLSFEYVPLNEVDNLIFSELAYLNLEDIVPHDDSYRVSLEFVRDKYKMKEYDQSYLINDPWYMLDSAVLTDRFKGVMLSRYSEIIDADKHIQFSAVTFHLPDGSVYVGFSGTDNTICGWREDFNFSFLDQTPGQTEAVKYLNEVCEENCDEIYVGGHSKGGNFAIYAAAFCDSPERIKAVFSNDGPGFNEQTADAEEYKKVLEKTRKYIPESSFIGILLESRANATVVKSDAKGIQQHNPYSWEIIGSRFEEADQRSFTSLFMDETLERWISSLDRDQKELFIGTMFDAIESSGVETFSELRNSKWVSYNAILKAVTKLDAKTALTIMSSLKDLAFTSKDVLWNETKRQFEKIIGTQES